MFAALSLLPETAAAVLSGTNGRIVFASGRNEADDSTAKLYLRQTFSSTGGPGTVTGPLATTGGVQHRHPTWSPDRTKIAYAAGAGSPCNCDIFILDLTDPNATPQNITNSNNVLDDRPAWSPDSTTIAFESENVDTGANPTQLNLKFYDVATGNTTNFTDTTNLTFEHKPAWTPDSQFLYYVTGDPFANNAMNIVKQSRDGGPIDTSISPNPTVSDYQPSISPDGTRMCFTRGTAQGSADSRVWVADSTGAQQMPLPIAALGTSYNCTFSPDGVFVAYVQGSFSNGDMLMERSDLSGGFAPLESTLNRFDGNPDWAPDGRPTCDDPTIETLRDTPVTVPLNCSDTGPEYEQTSVEISLPGDSGPASGTVGEIQPGTPPTVTYTPNAGFTGTDAFDFLSRDEVAFGDRGTATITVKAPPKCKGKEATIFGDNGNDTLIGTGGRDVIAGRGGKDKIRAKGGNDLVCAGGGKDNAKGGGGKDKVFGGAKKDTLAGNGGRDKLIGQGGKDTLRGGGGNDTLKGGAKADILIGGPGLDVLAGGPGSDQQTQ